MSSDLDKALASLNARIARAKGGAMSGLMELGQQILEDAKSRVPVKSGELRDSAYIKAVSSKPSVVELGFSAAHARLIHDDDDMKLEGQPRPSGGVYWGPAGEADFLESAVKAHRSRAAQIVAGRAK